MISGSGQLFAQNEAVDQGTKSPDPDFQWPDGNRMALSLTFDDARPSQLDTGIPLFRKYGVRVTFYVSPERMMRRPEAWKQVVQEGHEIGNHSMTHPCSGNFPWSRQNALETMTRRDIARELETASKVIEDFLGIRPVSFAYPCGQKFVGKGRRVQSYVPVISKMFLTGRGWLDEGPNDPMFCDLAQLTGMESDNKSFEDIKALIDRAAENNAWLVLAGHEIGEPASQTTWSSMLEELCAYANDPGNGIWMAPVGNIAEYVREHQERK
jgi:peptidoglycan/xylan/chitin deacetylase (PgdA/CDA1 family)